MTEMLSNDDAKLSPVEICTTFPLYQWFDLTDEDAWKLRYERFRVDAFCIWCNRESIFQSTPSITATYGPGDGLKGGRFTMNLVCQRSAGHQYVSTFAIVNKRLVKYGQLPSIADIATADIRKYRGVVEEKYFVELSKAIGLISHGIGVGSFVYLRRIFEHLIETHRAEYEAANSPIADWERKRMDDKIGALATVLPPALVKNKATYSILSVGIHSLEEDQCKRYFNVVKAAIVEILDQDLRQKQAEAASKALEAEIGRIAGEIKGGADAA